jgi:hypothetical protein
MEQCDHKGHLGPREAGRDSGTLPRALGGAQPWGHLDCRCQACFKLPALGFEPRVLYIPGKGLYLLSCTPQSCCF